MKFHQKNQNELMKNNEFNRKKELQKKFLQNVKIVSDVTTTVDIERNKKSRGISRSLKKEQRKLDDKISELNKRNNEYRIQVEKYKRTNFELSEEIKIVSQQLSRCIEVNKELEDKYAKIKVELSEQIRKNEIVFEHNSAKIKRLERDNLALSTKLAAANAENLYKRNQLKIEELQQRVSLYLNKIEEQQNKIEETSSENVSGLIKKLENRIGKFSKEEYDKLKTLFNQVEKNFDPETVDEMDAFEVEVSQQVGIAYLEENNWLFKNLYDEIYPLDLMEQQIQQHGAPVTVDLVKNVAYLRTIHRGNRVLRQTQEQINKSKAQKDTKVKRIFLNNIKVLIITGSTEKRKYKQRLKLHGVDVELHNPFKESDEMLYGKFERAEIVIVVSSHIPHSVLDHIDVTKEKVEVMEKDSIVRLLSRIRYAGIRLNILKP